MELNRRRFLELLGMAAAGTGIVYSFPSVIVPKNIAVLSTDIGQQLNPAPQDLMFARWVDFYEQQLIKSKEWFQANDWTYPAEEPITFNANVLDSSFGVDM